jgi:hypothetical protein
LEDWAPACCGSGCAVCVLDDLNEFSQPEPPEKKDEAGAEVALCCGTGCTVCVLDLPPTADGSIEELLTAFEGALVEAGECQRGSTEGMDRQCTMPVPQDRP